MNNAVERAARYIWERYRDPLSLADIARSALLSRSHLSRTFPEITGVSPGRFLSAVRIYKAKRMLLISPMSIAEIAMAVGYSSLGQFMAQFTDSVGIAPGLFRHAVRRGYSAPGRLLDPAPEQGAIYGKISLPAGYARARVYVGAFTTPIVEHGPAAVTAVDVVAGERPTYRLPDIPRGRWFIHAVGTAESVDPGSWTRKISVVGRHKPVPVTGHTVTSAAISLRPRQLTDPPVLLVLPELDTPGEVR